MNTKRFILFMTISFAPFLAGASQTIQAASSPMVERHIFGPDDAGDQGPEPLQAKSAEVEKLEKQLLFTGVIMAPDGKRAMVQEKVRTTKDTGRATPLKEGDEISGMTIKEIGRNYLVLTGTSGDVRLGLFRTEKERPAPAPEPKMAEAAPASSGTPGQQQAPVPAGAPGQQQSTETPGQPSEPPVKAAPPAAVFGPGPGNKTTPGETAAQPQQPSEPVQQEAAPAPNPFADALKKSQERGAVGQEGRRNQVNPFLDAIRRSQKQP
jgi:hypothetical protein